jgi:hypothetical protein
MSRQGIRVAAGQFYGRALAVIEGGGRVLGRLGEYGRLEVGARVEQVDLGDGVVAAHCRRVERATRTR